MQLHTKIIFILGALTTLIGVILISTSRDSLGDLVDFELSDTSEGMVSVIDSDGNGDLGFTFYIGGEYLDDDKDGLWDHCDNLIITIIEKPTVAKWDGDKNGDFYFEANNDGKEGCNVSDGKDTSRSGFVKIGRACLACYSGDLKFESNEPVSVQYDDIALGQWFEGIGVGFGGFGCICCGVLILLIGVIWLLFVDDDSESPPGVIYSPANDGTYQQNQHQSEGVSTSVTNLKPSRSVISDEPPTTVIQDSSDESTDAEDGKNFWDK